MSGFTVRPPIAWRPSQYQGEATIGIAATQLDNKGLGPAERRRILGEWIEFLSSSPTNIRELQFVSRVPQELLDSVAGQQQIEALAVKWGPYRDVAALGALAHLATLRLAGATALGSLQPLIGLPNLVSLNVSQAHRLDGTNALSELVGLTSLSFGNDHPGSDKSMVIADLRWVEPLQGLRSLALPGTRLVNPDLSPLLALPHLAELTLPLRRAYRKQVFSFAEASPLFAQVARKFEEYESWKAQLGL